MAASGGGGAPSGSLGAALCARLHSLPARLLHALLLVLVYAYFVRAPLRPAAPAQPGLHLAPSAAAAAAAAPAPARSPAAPLRGSADWEGTCGRAWQPAYAALHASIVSGAAPLRTLVSVAVEAGIADRLSGLVSQFLLALVQGRALQHVTYGSLPDWEVAYALPRLAARAPRLGGEVLDCVKFTYRGERGYMGPREHDPALVDPAAFYPLYLTNDYQALASEIFTRLDLATVPLGHAGAATLVSASNRGRSYVLFDNPHHAAGLRALGLTPDNAFACVHNFLFELAPGTCDATCAQHAQILDAAGAAGTLRIAIHVREGDAAFASAEGAALAQWQHAEAHFSCAEEVAASRAAPGQGVLFYFNSDSLPLRRAAAERYGARLLTDLRGAGQTDCAFHGGCDSVNASFRLAVAQLDLFSRADVHIVSTGSGYGAMGAWMSALQRHGEAAPRSRSSHIYRVTNGEFRDCSPAAADDARAVATGWAGF